MSQEYYLETLKVFQLKDIARIYFDEEHPELKIKYKTKNRTQLIELINRYNIKIENYAGRYITELPGKNLLKKYNTQKFNKDQQQQFVEEETKKREEYENDPSKTDILALVPRKGSIENMSLQKHQTDFIKQFIYSNLHGAIMYHGVGSGKTLTAVVSSYWYLQLYPDNKIIVISPSALLYNFIEGMRQYGLSIQDNRYTFTTYEKYVRLSETNKKATNCLLIVDEAHNCRTEMKVFNLQNPDTGEVVGQSSRQNKRGFNILEYGAMNSHKILLLTGTAFVNSIYDIENLLAMIDKRTPLEKLTFDNALGSPSNITDYFSYRISYFASPKSIYFPERREKLIYLEMSKDMEDKYIDQKNNGGSKNAFLIDERKASNSLYEKNQINPKVKWCIDEISKNTTQKFIIYAGLYNLGIELLESALNKNKINYVKITGREDATIKERNKNFYNAYNGKDFNSRVLLISKAGAEGVDTKNTQNIILLDHQWNDALSEQIIARAIRYKSHFELPVKERYVNVYRLFLCGKDSKSLFDKVNKGEIDYVALNNEIKSSVRKQQDILKMKDNVYLPTIRLLKSLKVGDTDELFIPENNITGKISQGFRKKKAEGIIREGWEEYKKLSNDGDRKLWRIKKYSEWFVSYSPDRAKQENIIGAVDLRLYILCKAKQSNIETFISYFGNRIKVFEEFQSVFLKKIIEEEGKYGKKLNDKAQSLIYSKALKNEKDEVKKLLFEKRTRTQQEKLQQYYTPPDLAQLLVDKSKISDQKTSIRVLEPTAGDGSLILPIMKLTDINFTLDIIELDKDNRKKLEELSKGRNSIHLLTHKNFLTYISGGVYDFIYMNPPFHLRKNENSTMLRDVYDFDFVERAFAMLKVGGILMGIIGNSFDTLKNERPSWLKSHCKPKKIEAKKYSGVLITNTYMIQIVKKNNDEDKGILNKKFYASTDLTLGTEIVNGEFSLTDLKTEPTEKTEYK